MRDSNKVEVKVRDRLHPVTLRQAELSGEIGESELDAAIRPDGRKVSALAKVETKGEWSKGAPQETLVFTEFIDPTGIMTYFHVLDLAHAAEDELIGDCFGDQRR